MYTLLKNIINISNDYTNLYNFYLDQFSMYISLLDFFFCISLINVFLFLIIRFFILRFTLKVVLIFLLKRLLFAFLIFLLIDLNLFVSFCDMADNTKIFNNDTKKYTCIAIVAITGCYLGYRYIPVWYNSVTEYTKYTNYLIYENKMVKYDLDFNAYLKQIELKKLSMQELKKNKLEETTYNLANAQFSIILDNFIANYKNISKPLDIFFTSRDIKGINNFLHDFKLMKGLSKDYLNEYDWKFLYLVKNYEKIESIILQLKTNNNVKIVVDRDAILETQIKLFESLAELCNFYATRVIPLSSKFCLSNGNFKDPRSITDVTLNMKITNLYLHVDSLIERSLKLSIKMLENVEGLLLLPEVIKPEVLEIDNFGFSSIIRPKKPKIPEEFIEFKFPTDNLDGIKFISINCGYIFFYPLLYSSNKVLGTVNPLSEKLFKEAIFFFFTGWF